MEVEQSADGDVQVVRQLALTAAFTALVFLSTSLFSIGLVSSTGFFNLGEAFVYLGALVGGPVVGGVAGGLGAALADAFLGYGYFAPATLVLKGLEGFTVGLLFILLKKISSTQRRSFLAVVTAFLICFTIYFTTPILNGFPNSDIIEGSVNFGTSYVTFSLPGWILVLVALILMAIIWSVEIRMQSRGEMALSCILAGPIMIVGYFLYEILFLEIAIEAALFEVPFNIAQVVFGTFIAVPIVTYLDELGILNSIKKNSGKILVR
jgi:uncharacterized membrane protein